MSFAKENYSYSDVGNEFNGSNTLCEKCSFTEFFCSVFSRIQNNHGDILRISTYSVRKPENTDQKNSEYGHFQPSDNEGQYDDENSNLIPKKYKQDFSSHQKQR